MRRVGICEWGDRDGSWLPMGSSILQIEFEFSFDSNSSWFWKMKLLCVIIIDSFSINNKLIFYINYSWFFYSKGINIIRGLLLFTKMSVLSCKRLKRVKWNKIEIGCDCFVSVALQFYSLFVSSSANFNCL